MVRNPVRLICILRGSGVLISQAIWARVHEDTGRVMKEERERTHRLRVVFEETHRVLDDDFVFETHKFDDLLDDPRADDGQIYFSHIHLQRKYKLLAACIRLNQHLFVELWGKLHRFEELELFVRKAAVLVRRCAFEEPYASSEALQLIQSQMAHLRRP